MFLCWCCALSEQRMVECAAASTPSTTRTQDAHEGKTFSVLAGAEADVGSTAAAAVASALSSAWSTSAVGSRKHQNGTAKGGLTNGESSNQSSQLPPRQRFEVVVRLGTQKCVHTLSDPTVRQHVRRLTSMQARLQPAPMFLSAAACPHPPEP